MERLENIVTKRKGSFSTDIRQPKQCFAKAKTGLSVKGSTRYFYPIKCPPIVRRVIQISPVQEDGKRQAEHVGQLPQIPLVRLTPNSTHMPIISLLDQRIPEVSPGHPARCKPPPQVVTPQIEISQGGIYGGIAMEHQDFTTKIPELSTKTENLQSCDYSYASSIDLEGIMVDNAIDNVMNLPQAFNEVVEMQKDQSNEIQRQQLILKNMQKKLKEELEKKEDLVQEITGVTHKIYIADERNRKCNKKCKEYDLEIKEVVKEYEQIRNRIKEVEEEIEQNKRQYDKYRELMTSHKQVVADFEGDLEVYKEIKELKEAISELENENKHINQNVDETNKLLSGQLEKELKDQIQTTRECIEELKLSIIQKINLIQEEKNKQNQLQLSFNVLQKKNAAQLTRLKKQVKAAQQNKRQWHDQISQLHKSIDEMKNKLAQDV